MSISMSEYREAFTQLAHQYLAAIEDELCKSVRQTAKDELIALHNMLAYHMGWEGKGSGPEARGKRIRPLLVLLTCTAAGGDWQQALPAATAVELVHNFSLIHDDIEDNSPLRRGRPTLWKLWGIPQAINAGDAMYALAHLEILRLEETLTTIEVVRAARLMQQTCLHLTQGQFLDLSYQDQNERKLDEYWPMISGKTAALLTACTQLGALVARATPEHQEHYAEFGRFLGLAFQVQDDLLGVWGDAELTGKSAESDLVAGKNTLPVLYGIEKNGTFAKRWRQGPISSGEVIVLAHILEEEGARSYCETFSTRLTSQALEALESAQPQGIAGKALIHLANLLLNRQE